MQTSFPIHIYDDLSFQGGLSFKEWMALCDAEVSLNSSKLCKGRKGCAENEDKCSINTDCGYITTKNS